MNAVLIFIIGLVVLLLGFISVTYCAIRDGLSWSKIISCLGASLISAGVLTAICECIYALFIKLTLPIVYAFILVLLAIVYIVYLILIVSNM